LAESTHVVPTEVKDAELIAARRRQFTGVALGLFQAQGFSRTTVREIARAVGVSVGLLYLYFGSKEDILALACHEFVERFTAAATATADTSASPARQLEQAFSLLIEVADQESNLHLVVYREMPNLPRTVRRFITQQELDLVTHFKTILDRGVAEGCFRPHDTRLRAHSLVMLGHMWALKRWALRGTVTTAEYTKEQIDHCLHGIAAAPAANETAEV